MSFLNINTIYDEAGQFLDRLLQEVQVAQMDIKYWDIDHLCFRVETSEQYLQMKEEFNKFAALLAETEVNGRPISSFKLHKPIKHQRCTIDVIELPAPKAGKKEIFGFEHIEVVVDEPLCLLAEKYYYLKQNKKNIRKDFNAELELILGSGSIKFHFQSLETIIRIEENQRVQDFLKESQILNRLQEYHPLIAGTFPLNLNIEKSDLDIICDYRDPNLFCSEIEKFFGHFPDFKITKTSSRQENAIVCNWIWKDLPVEIFAQSTFSCRQWGFKHFQIEDRILKLAGRSAFKKIRELRLKGFKTEIAFWLYLNESIMISPDEDRSIFLIENDENIRRIDDENIYAELFEASFLNESQLVSKYKNIFVYS